MVEEGRGSKVQESQGPRVPKSKGPKDQDISKSHSNTSLTLKKVHLVYYLETTSHNYKSISITRLRSSSLS